MDYEDIKNGDTVLVDGQIKIVRTKDIENGGCYVYFSDGSWVSNLDEVIKIDENINEYKIKEFNLDLLGELKNCINCMISERIKYDCFETNEKRKENNKINLKKDYQLLEIIINKLNKK